MSMPCLLKFFFFTECSTFCSFLSELPLFCPYKWGVLFQNAKTVTTAATKGLLGYNSRCIITKDINKLDDDVASMTFHTSCSFVIFNNKNVFTFLAVEQYGYHESLKACSLITTKGQPLNAAFMTRHMFAENQSHAREDRKEATDIHWLRHSGWRRRPPKHTQKSALRFVLFTVFHHTLCVIIRHITAPFCVFLMIMLISLMYVCCLCITNIF